MMKRREALAAVAVTLAMWTLVAVAQNPHPIPRIGILSSIELGADGELLTAALRELGYVDRASAILVWRSAAGKGDRLGELAGELVQLKVDVIVTVGSSATQAARTATTTVPIVFSVGDAVGAGFVSNLARPAGNLTGISTQISDFAPKCLQLLKEVRPELTEVTVLFSRFNVSAAPFLREAENAAPAMHLKLQPVIVASGRTADLDAALAAIERAPPRAMVVLDQDDARIGAFAIRNRIATIALRQLGDAGWLMSYGATSAQINRQVADYVDKILKGAKPTELPVRQPTKLELVINLKTAKAIGLSIPQSLLLRADEVIQ